MSRMLQKIVFQVIPCNFLNCYIAEAHRELGKYIPTLRRSGPIQSEQVPSGLHWKPTLSSGLPRGKYPLDRCWGWQPIWTTLDPTIVSVDPSLRHFQWLGGWRALLELYCWLCPGVSPGQLDATKSQCGQGTAPLGSLHISPRTEKDAIPTSIHSLGCMTACRACRGIFWKFQAGTVIKDLLVPTSNSLSCTM